MIFGPQDAEFRVELAGAKKCVHQNPPKDRASNGKTVLSPVIIDKFPVISFDYFYVLVLFSHFDEKSP